MKPVQGPTGSNAEQSIFESTFDCAAVGIAHLSTQGRWLRVNDKLCEITGYSPAELLELSFLGITHPDDLARDFDNLDKLLSRQLKSYCAEKRYIRKDGSLLWVSVDVSIVFNPDQTPAYGISIIQDISARKQAEQQVTVAHQRYQALFEQMPDGILLLDESLKIIGHNDEAERLLKFGSRPLQGLHIHDLELRDKPEDVEARRLRIETTGRDAFESIFHTGDGKSLDVDVSVKFVRLVNGERLFQVLFRDISDKKQAARFVEKMAYSDPLTGLANRALLSDRLLQAMAHARRRHSFLAVAFLDLDGFKAVNDLYGHPTGDALLMALSNRMRDALRDGDTLARLGGDEFIAVLADLPLADSCIPLLHRLLEVAALPVVLGDRILRVTASLGVTFYPQPEEVDADQLMRQADQAMYQAKLAGKNRFHLFDADRDRNVRGYIAQVEKIQEALVQQQFLLHYQPKVNMKTRQVIGVEALVRWQHPVDGLLMPARFLPTIENHPLSLALGHWVLHEALSQVARWRDQGHDIPVSVNIGALQIQQYDFFDQLRSELAQFDLPPHSLELEILETSALEDLDTVGRFIARCMALNVGFAMDDFGTGYSSLTYLKNLPATTVKIDQSFVRDMLKDLDNKSILDGVLWIMRQLNRKVIAEGVETLEHGRALMDLGCEFAQGYGIARPMPPEKLLSWITAWENDADWQSVALVPRTAV